MGTAETPSDYRIVALYDAHLRGVRSREELHESLRVALDFLRDIRPEVVVVGGDFLDMQAISRHSLVNGDILNLEGLRLQDDFATGRRVLEEIAMRAGAIYYLEGNHEHWATRLVERYPGLCGLLDIPSLLGLGELGVSWIPFNQVLRLGKLNFIHGWYHNKYHAMKHLDAMGSHVIYGHTHDHQKFIRIVRSSGEPYLAMSVGCLCSTNPHYLRNRPNEWVNGVGYIEVDSDGDFVAHFIPIINGKLRWAGQVWRATST